MAVRTVTEEDFGKLIELYKEFFPTHNRFSQNEDIIKAYLHKELLEQDDFLITEGAALIVIITKCNDTHSRAKFRHFAWKNEEAATELLQEAESRVRKSAETVKIELTLSESEEIEFYKKNGYVVEGELKDHYRAGEVCFILGKSFL
jgi:hypothetical protein